MRSIFSRIAAVAIAVCATTQGATAFEYYNYTTTSKLAQGHWVKIAVPADGVYELTAEQLSQMGFSSPESVRIFGHGGHIMSEALNGRSTDDLAQIPTLMIGGKLCFYGKGPLDVTLTGGATSTPHFVRTFNPYSNYGYYFLTEDAGEDLRISNMAASSEQGSVERATCMSYVLHEQELTSLSRTGKDLLGEAMTDAPAKVQFTLPELVPGTAIMVNPCVAANSTASSYVKAYLNMGGERDTASFTISQSRITAPSTTYVLYKTASPVAAVTPKSPAEQGTLEVDLLCSTGTISSSYLDYAMLSYTRRNKLQPTEAQMLCAITQLTTSDRVAVADSNLRVWYIDNTDKPVQYGLERHTETDSLGVATTSWCFTPRLTKTMAHFVMFNPSDTLLRVASWETVPNQNIHGDSVPDMVIVTNTAFLDQAERIADKHRQNDSMRVNVYDQVKIFNEFTSGTPDAMALRMMNKMFYDRDTEARFRYMLLLGCGSYDNRGITTDKPNRVITYESDESNDESYSYVSDDFYGILDDYSGIDLSSDMLRLGVGRIPSADLDECKADIDKLFNYIDNPDYGVWRNNMLFTCDQGDNDLHQFQAEGVAQLVSNQVGSEMIINRCYNGMFPFATELAEGNRSNHTATQAKRYISEQLKAGQYFMTFIGHADATTFTKYTHMWTNNDVQSTNNRYLPIVTTACCDVARYDSDTRGIAEIMFHKTDGGAIALLTSARAVYANSNDQLNRAFVQTMLSATSGGDMPRLGDAYIASKQAFGTTTDYSKMSFLLLGDPAMKFNYPLPNFNLTELNGTAITDSATVTARPMQKLEIVAQVIDPATGSVDESFNGTGTVTLYDRLESFADVQGYNQNNVLTTRHIDYPRAQLAQVSDSVHAGVLRATIVVPRYVKASGHECLLSLYAHKSGTTSMVNGQWDALTVASYDSTDSATITDTTAPVIETMFMGDEQSFAQETTVPANSTLYITATDDVAISTQEQSIGGSMTLMLDGGGTTYDDITRFAEASDGGKSVAIAYPMSGLSAGRHTLTYTVADAAGNTATRSIGFVVNDDSQLTLTTESQAPADTLVTFTADAASLTTTPEVTLHVTDGAGRLVWTATTSTFPCQWDLTDSQGQRVAPGRYHYWGTYQAGTSHGGTSAGSVIVIEPVQRSAGK